MQISDIDKESARRLKRGRMLSVLCMLGIYIVSYFPLSYNGTYIAHNKGGQDNRITWFPAYCAERYMSFAGRQKVRITAVGEVFLPIMLFDQLIIHRTHYE